MKSTKVFICLLLVCAIYSAADAQSTFIDEGRNATGLSLGYGYFNIRQSESGPYGFVGSFGVSRAGILEAGAGAVIIKDDDKTEFAMSALLGLFPVRLAAGPITFMPGFGAEYQVAAGDALWAANCGIAMNFKFSRILSIQNSLSIGKYSSLDKHNIEGVISGLTLSIVLKTSYSDTYLISSTMQRDEGATGIILSLSVIWGNGINGDYKSDLLEKNSF